MDEDIFDKEKPSQDTRFAQPSDRLKRGLDNKKTSEEVFLSG